MDDQQVIIEKCMSYLNQTADKETCKEVEQNLLDNQEWKDIMAETRMIHEGFQLQKEYEQAKKIFDKPKVKTFSMVSWGMAAGIVLIGLFGYLGLSKAYFPKLLHAPSVLMGEEEAPNPKAGEEVYSLFVKGQSLLEAQDFDKAIENFEQALTYPNLRNQLKEAIQWHLCVAYLRAGQTQKSSELYQQLKSLNDPKYELGFWSKSKIGFQLFLKQLFE